MRAEYDFAKMKGRRNPYASRLKKPVTIRLGSDVIVLNHGAGLTGLHIK
jgi:hypothetical protein